MKISCIFTGYCVLMCSLDINWLRVILSVRYFDKNSAKCGRKYIKSILNTAILY